MSALLAARRTVARFARSDYGPGTGTGTTNSFARGRIGLKSKEPSLDVRTRVNQDDLVVVHGRVEQSSAGQFQPFNAPEQAIHNGVVVPRRVESPLFSPEDPSEPDRGRPLAFVNVNEDGVPNAGATSVGEVESTIEPEPVELVEPVPPLSTVSGFCRVIELNLGDG